MAWGKPPIFPNGGLSLMVLPPFLDGLRPFLAFIVVILFLIPLCFLVGKLLKMSSNIS